MQQEHFQSCKNAPQTETHSWFFFFPSPDTKGMGQRVWWRKRKSFCVMCVSLWVSLWKPWSSSSAQKLYPCVPVFSTEGTSRLELAERRLPSCQDLDLMAFWAQLLERLGTVPRRMCHPPTACAVTGDGWGLELREAHSNIFFFHWKLVCLYPGALCLSLASPLLSIPSSSSKRLVSEQTALCFWQSVSDP